VESCILKLTILEHPYMKTWKIISTNWPNSKMVSHCTYQRHKMECKCPIEHGKKATVFREDCAVHGNTKNCQTCKRRFDSDEGRFPVGKQDEHHLIPKCFLKGSQKKKAKKIILCRRCHNQIHKLFTNHELKNKYNTLYLLMAQPEIITFIKWITKVPF